MKDRRDQIYEKYTSYLLPTFFYNVKETEHFKFPQVSFNILYINGSFSAKVFVRIQVFLGNKLIEDFAEISEHTYYGGKKPFRMNPGGEVTGGNFKLSEKVVKAYGKVSGTKEKLKLKLNVWILDKFEYKHDLLPIEYVYWKNKKY